MKNQMTFAMGGVAMLAGLASASAQDSNPLFKIGSVDVRPHATYSVAYDDNIFLEHKAIVAGLGNPGRDHDFVHTFTPGLRLNAGDVAVRQAAYFDANYEVVLTKFTDYKGSDATDHNASIEFGGKLNRLSVSVEQTLASRSDADTANLAANGRVKRKTWETRVNSDYEVSEKTSVSLDLKQTIGDYTGLLVDSVDRSAALWLDHQVLPKVKAGLGATVGYLQIDGTAATHNPNSSYIQGLGRVDWAATEKTTIRGSAGIESRNIQERGISDPVTFVFTLGADWKAAERTVVTLTASRGTKVSNAQVGQLNEETSIVAGVKHSLWERISLGLDGGYAFSHYKAVSTVLGALRDDAYFFAKPSIAYRFVERAQAVLYYQYRRNDSTLAGNGNDFYNNQVGLELSYRF